MQHYSNPCVTSVTIIVFENIFHQTSPCFEQILFAKDQNTVSILEEKSRQNTEVIARPVTFVTHKRFTVLFFLSPCGVSSLLLLVLIRSLV